MMWKKRRSKRLSGEIMLSVASTIEVAKRGPAVLTDISGSGLSFMSNVLFNAGDEISIRFTFADNNVFLFIGNIVRMEKLTVTYKYGASFLGLNFRTKRKIKKLIKIISSN
ncbi:MAG: PilZ domain-containing protein [Elusimicrobiota bacterium]